MDATAGARLLAALIAASFAASLCGCASPVAVGYAVRDAPADPVVGTAELTIAPAYRVQQSTEPVFAIRFVNRSERAAWFGPAQVKVSFRGAPIALLTREEHAAALRSRAVADEIGEIVLGSIAAAALLYGLSQSSVGVFSNGAGTVVVREGGDHLLAAVAVGAAAGTGLQGVQERSPTLASVAPRSILAARRVEPGAEARGLLVLKDCCDASQREGDAVRFEVTLDDRSAVFEFARTWPEDAAPIEAGPAAPKRGRPQAASVASNAVDAPGGGRDAWVAERAARAEACEASDRASLVDKRPGEETWSVPCADGRALRVRCVFGRCAAYR